MEAAGYVRRKGERGGFAITEAAVRRYEEMRSTSYYWSTAKADNHESWIDHILRREAESLIRLQPQANASTSPASTAPVRST
jgi:hypothetical protein